MPTVRAPQTAPGETIPCRGRAFWGHEDQRARKAVGTDHLVGDGSQDRATDHGDDGGLPGPVGDHGDRDEPRDRESDRVFHDQPWDHAVDHRDGLAPPVRAHVTSGRDARLPTVASGHPGRPRPTEAWDHPARDASRDLAHACRGLGGTFAFR
jgi:hypothetical protein